MVKLFTRFLFGGGQLITISSNEQNNQFDVCILIESNKLQECCEVCGFLHFMINHDPAMLNAVLDQLMTEITESTYEMDPERFEMYKNVLEGNG